MSITANNSQELIQALLNAANGEVIHLGPGVFEGPFPILRDNLTLVGAGTGATTLRGALAGAAEAHGLLLRDLEYDPLVIGLDGADGNAADAGEGMPGWVTDRAPVASRALAEDPEDAANAVLAFTTSGAGDRDGHHAYQGAQYRPGTDAGWDIGLGGGLDVTYRFHVNEDFSSDGNVQKSGLWLGFQNEAGNLPAGGWYVVLEYVDADGAAALAGAAGAEDFTGGFRIWLDAGAGGAGGWTYVNHAATGWVDLGIGMAPDATSIAFRVNGEVIHVVADPAGDAGISRLELVTINSRNDSGVDTTYLYDDLVVRANPTGHDVYGAGWTLQAGPDGWFVTDGVEQVQLDNVSRVQVDGTSYALVGHGAFGTIQSAINAAAAGDTVLIAGGTYAENLVMDGKAVNLVSAGAEVTLSPSSGVALTLRGDLGAGSTVHVQGIDIADTVGGVHVKDGAVLGMLHIDDAHISDLKDWGIRVGDATDGPGSATSLGALVITGSVFYDVGGRNSAGNGAAVKLWRFQGDLRIQDTEFTGHPLDYVTKAQNAPANAIEIQGVDNRHVAEVVPIGNVVIEDVTVNGGFTKNPVGIFNYANVDGLTIEGLDLSNAHSAWTGLLNIDGVTGTIDGSGFQIIFPAGSLPVTELQGEKAGSDAADNDITGTSGNDVIRGKAGNDRLEGSGGNDLLLGEEGMDTAAFSGNRADYSIIPDRANGGWMVSDLRDGAPDGADILLGVEWLEFADGLVDVDSLDTAVTWIVDASGLGDFTDVNQAIAMALDGDRIEIRAGSYASFVVDKPLTIVGDPGAVVEGSFFADNNIPDGANLDEWLQFATSYNNNSGNGILVAASGVHVSGLTIEGFQYGVRLAGGPAVIEDTELRDLAIFNVVTGVANTFGDGDTVTSQVDGIHISGLHIAHAYQGIEIQDPHNKGGLFSGLVLENSTFEHILAKGIYAELLSDSLLAGLTMFEVGQFGRARPFGEVGVFGNGIDLNLKWGDFAGIIIDGFQFIDVGLSYGGGAPHGGGGAITVKAREDGGYASDPATYEGVLIIRNGSIDGTSTGVRVGEPNVTGLSGITVLVENVAVADHLVSRDFGAFDNRTDETMTVTGPEEVDTGAASGNILIPGSSAADSLVAGRGDDILTGGEGDDFLAGGAGDDRLIGGAGNDSLRGDEGHDVAVFQAPRGEFSIRFEGPAVVVTHRDGGALGVDRVTGVEVLEFDDVSYDLTAPIHVFDADGELSGVFHNLEQALAAAQDGDTVVLAAGNYALDVNGGFTGHLDAAITLRGANAGITGHGVRGAESVLHIEGDALQLLAAGIVIEGISVQGRLEAAPAAFDVVIRDSRLDAADGTALRLRGADGAHVTGNHIVGAVGIEADGFGELVITGNHIHASDTGLRLASGEAAEDARITGNLFSGGDHGVSLQGTAGAYANATAINIKGNTFLSQSEVAVHAAEALPASLDASLGTSLPLNLYGTAPSNRPHKTIEVLFTTEEGDLIIGGAGNDVLSGTGGDDILRGGGGDDELHGGAGNDRLYGGAGHDVAVFSGQIDDYIFSRRDDGAIVVFGPDGTDELYGIERVRFSEGPDVLVSDLPGITPKEIEVHTPEALQGALDALLLAGDSVSVGEEVSGAQASLSGNASISLGNAQGLSLQVSDDAGITNVVIGGTGSVSVSNNSAGGIIDASTLLGNAQLSGGNGNDVLRAGGGNDTLVASHGGGRNVLDGGQGDNTVTFTSATGGVTLDLDAGILEQEFLDAWADGDELLLGAAAGKVGGTYGFSRHDSGTDPDSSALLFNLSSVVGSVQDDLLIGDGAGNTFDGYGGTDEIIGKDGDDVVLFRGAPADYEITRLSTTEVAGRNDAIAARLGEAGMAADGFEADLPVFRVRYIGEDPELAGTDALVQVETLRFDQVGGVVDYTISQDDEGRYYLQLPDGGVAWIIDASSESNNLVQGGDGDDELRGGAGEDRLLGGEGADTLSGGAGSDYLDGGEGADIYELDPSDIGGEDADVIEDTGSAGVVDILRLTGAGTADLRNGSISGIERLEYAAAGNTVVLESDNGLLEQQAQIVGGASEEDALEVHVRSGASIALDVQDVEVVRLVADGDGRVNLEDVMGAAIEVGGDANLVLDGASDAINASQLTGSLQVNAVHGAALALATGSGDTGVNASGGDTANIDATQLDADATLELSGDRGFMVTGLAGNLDASGTSAGLYVVTAGSGGDGDIHITSGSGQASIHGSSASDQIHVANTTEADAHLDLAGSSDFNVAVLGGVVDASTATGNVGITVLEGGGRLVARGGLGDDLIRGGDEDDELNDGAGSDELHGGGGDDLLISAGDGCTDYFFGGEGTDTVQFSGAREDYQLDVVLVTRGDTPERMLRVTHKDTSEVDYVGMDVELLQFGDADPISMPVVPVVLFDALGEEAGFFSSLAGAIAAATAGGRIEIGDDTDLSGEGMVVVTTENLTIAGGASVTIAGLILGEGIHGLRLEGGFNARVIGNELDNFIVGNAGDNRLEGGAGNDVLVGGGGNDVLLGGAGNDLLVLGGDGGRVVAQGDTGSDRFILDAADMQGSPQFNVIINDFRAGQDVLDFGHLRGAEGALTLADLGLTPAPSARIPLDGLLADGELEVAGTVTLSGVNAMRLPEADFNFAPDLAADWESALLIDC